METNTHKALCELLKGDYRHETSIQLVKRVEGLLTALRKERDDAMGTNTHKLLNALLDNKFYHESNELLIKRVEQRMVALRKERDYALQLRDAYNSNVKDWRELCSYFNLPVSELSTVITAVGVMRKERDELRETVRGIKFTDTPKQRYVLHGDIKPCTVLYSDDTTTLLRLETQDMMCETETIEWSDELTYKCQELLKSGGTGRPLDILVSLVRDGALQFGEGLGADEVYFREKGPRWSDSLIEQPCDECKHVFDAESTTCPVCNTIRSGAPTKQAIPGVVTVAEAAKAHRKASRRKSDNEVREWTSNSSPTPLR